VKGTVTPLTERDNAEAEKDQSMEALKNAFSINRKSRPYDYQQF
jgi:hypothetical protein